MKTWYLTLGLMIYVLPQHLLFAQIQLNNLVRIKDEIPEGNCNVLAMDPKGLLYVGGQGHVSVFALGQRLALIPYQKLTGESQSSYFDRVYICPNADLVWVGDQKGLGFFKRKTFEPYQVISDSGEISGIVPFKDLYSILAIVKGTLFRFSYNPNSKKVFPKKDEDFSAIKITNIIQYKKDSLYLTDGQHLYLYPSTKPVDTKRIANNIEDIFNVGNGKLGVIATDKLWLYNVKSQKIEGSAIQLPIQLRKLSASRKVTGVKILGKYMYLGTHQGLFRKYLSSSKWEEITLKSLDGFPLKIVLSLETSADDVLLIGTRAGGVLMYSPQRERTFIPFHTDGHEIEELHDYSIRSFAKHPDKADVFFFGTDRGKVFKVRFQNQKLIYLDSLDLKNSELQIRSIAVSKKHIFLGTGINSNRLVRFDTTMNVHSKIDTFLDESIKTITSLQWRKVEGKLLVGTDKGLYWMDSNLKYSSKPRRASGIKYIAGNFVCSKGKLGILDTLKGSIKKWLYLPDSLRNVDLLYLTLSKEKKDSGWIFTRGKFIFRVYITNDTLKIAKSFDRRNGLVGYDDADANVAYGGFEDKDGNLWVSTNYGLYRLPKGEKYFSRFTPPILGLPDNVDANTGAFLKLNDSTFIFGFRHGGVLVQSNAFQMVQNKQLVVVEKRDNQFSKLIESNGSISKEKNFDGINLYPFNLDWSYGGAEPVIEENSEHSFQIGEAMLIKAVNVADEYDFLRFVFPSSQSGVLVQVKYTDNYLLEVQKDKNKNIRLVTGLSILVIGLSILAIVRLRQRRSRLKEQELELEAETIENKKSELVLALSHRALSNHFLKNQFNSISNFKETRKEILSHNILQETLNVSDLSKNSKNLIVKVIKEKLKLNNSNFFVIWKVIRENTAIKNSTVMNILYSYANLVEKVFHDIQRNNTHAEEAFGYYSNTISKEPTTSIKKDADSVLMFCRLQQQDLGDQFEFNTPDESYTPSSGDIVIMSDDIRFGNVEIPKMMVQALVENAIEYGSKPLRIMITYEHIKRDDRHWLNVSVINSGRLRSRAARERKSTPSTEIIKELVEKNLKGQWNLVDTKHEEATPQVKASICIPINLK